MVIWNLQPPAEEKKLQTRISTADKPKYTTLVTKCKCTLVTKCYTHLYALVTKCTSKDKIWEHLINKNTILNTQNKTMTDAFLTYQKEKKN